MNPDDGRTDESIRSRLVEAVKNLPMPPEELPYFPDRRHPYIGFTPGWKRDGHQLPRALFRTFLWTFVPHHKNAATRKIVTTVLMITWSAITIGIAFGYADPGQYYPVLTILVFSIVCTIWGFELGMLDAVTKGNIMVEEKDDDDQ